MRKKFQGRPGRAQYDSYKKGVTRKFEADMALIDRTEAETRRLMAEGVDPEEALQRAARSTGLNLKAQYPR